jgi:hypothetical protein
MSDIVWKLVNLCYEINLTIEGLEEHDQQNSELAEVKQTLHKYDAQRTLILHIDPLHNTAGNHHGANNNDANNGRTSIDFVQLLHNLHLYASHPEPRHCCCRMYRALDQTQFSMQRFRVSTMHSTL